LLYEVYASLKRVRTIAVQTIGDALIAHTTLPRKLKSATLVLSLTPMSQKVSCWRWRQLRTNFWVPKKANMTSRNYSTQF